MDYVVVALLLVIAWAVTWPMRKERDDRRETGLMKRLEGYYLRPKEIKEMPLSRREIKWLVKRGKLPPDFRSGENPAA